MDVRLARPTDAPLVLALSLDEHAHLVRSPDWPTARPVARTVARALVPFAAPGKTWIAQEGASCAVVEARPRRYVIGWDITRLAVRGDHDAVLGPAVEAVKQHVQARGVPRLFARCQDSVRSDLEHLGFRPLSREYVLAGSASVPVDEALPGDSRYRMPQDAWPLHQLESQITPPLVRQLEGLTSMEWAQRSKGAREIVVEQDGRVVGWIGWTPNRIGRCHQLGLLVHPEHCELAPSLLAHVLGTAEPGTRFVARVRDYQPETTNVLVSAGFEVVAEEILMVQHGRVALAPAERARLRVARVPGIPAMPFRMNIIGPGLGPTKEEIL
jgi:hypothetical protein